MSIDKFYFSPLALNDFGLQDFNNTQKFFQQSVTFISYKSRCHFVKLGSNIRGSKINFEHIATWFSIKKTGLLPENLLPCDPCIYRTVEGKC